VALISIITYLMVSAAEEGERLRDHNVLIIIIDRLFQLAPTSPDGQRRGRRGKASGSYYVLIIIEFDRLF
jgi:hypothetical protein